VIRHTGSVTSPYTYHKESEQFLDKTRDDDDEHVRKPAARFELRVTIYTNKEWRDASLQLFNNLTV
jgi:hypothetical protein